MERVISCPGKGAGETTHESQLHDEGLYFDD
jgi:hypothetical protein